MDRDPDWQRNKAASLPHEGFMDLILRNSRIIGRNGKTFDIGIDHGRIAAIEPSLSAEGMKIDLEGRLVSPGFIETHIHLDKSCILDRCKAAKGDLEEAIGEVAKAKRAFTAEDVYQRARRTLEKSILNGTTHMRTQLEVDPGIGLRGLEGVLPLIEEYKWAIDIEICIFPQEGLLNNPGTDELMVEALKRGGKVVGAAPYTDGDPKGQMDRVFEMAREFDIDIDMHLDFGPTPDDLDLLYVCELTDRYKYGGRVAIGHVTKLSAATPEAVEKAAKRMADAGVALTVLPSTDLYLMGRHMDHNVMRGVTSAHKLLHVGVNCSLSTNNVLNPFTPFGDCSLIRMANLYANICQVGARSDIRECFNMITSRSAALMRLRDYGVEIGRSADLVVLDCTEPEVAVAELVTPMYGFKRGRRTFTRQPAVLHRN
jgi:cytosine deaminase